MALLNKTGQGVRLTEIPTAEVLRYLGVRGNPDPVLLSDLSRCEALLRREIRPRAVWTLMDLKEDGRVGNSSLRLEGRDIRRHLQGCSQVILMAATLGTASETLLRRTQARDMADAVLLDALGSAAVENVCDCLCDDLSAAFLPRKLTGRFSPGYGDFPLDAQAEMCAVLNLERRMGVSLTAGGLMIPQKTVTAVIGVGDEASEDARGCGRCGLSAGCPYRKEGGTCDE